MEYRKANVSAMNDGDMRAWPASSVISFNFAIRSQPSGRSCCVAFPVSAKPADGGTDACSWGILVSHQTIGDWAEKFGRNFANDLPQRSAAGLGDRLHPDEALLQSEARNILCHRKIALNFTFAEATGSMHARRLAMIS